MWYNLYSFPVDETDKTEKRSFFLKEGEKYF